MVFTELEKDEFEKYLLTTKLVTFFQSPNMDIAEGRDGWKFLYLGVKKDNKIIAASRIKYISTHFNKKLFYAERGIIADYEDKELIKFFTTNIKSYLKKMNGYVFHIDPTIIYKQRDIDGNIVEGGIDNSHIIDYLKSLGYKHDGFNKHIDNTKQVRWSFELDIKDKSVDDILKEMNGNTRRAIQKAEHLQVKVRELAKEELPIFKDILESTSERKAFHDRTLAYYENMYDAFHDKNEIKYMLAYVNLDETIDVLNKDLEDLEMKKERALSHNKQGQYNELNSQAQDVIKRIDEVKKIKEEKGNMINLSAAMFMIYGHDILYFHSGSYKEYFSFFGQYSIQWEMIKLAIELKKDVYNFYGIVGVFDKSDPDYGVYLFKRGFNGKVIEYIGDFYLPLSPYYYLRKLLTIYKKKVK